MVSDYIKVNLLKKYLTSIQYNKSLSKIYTHLEIWFFSYERWLKWKDKWGITKKANFKFMEVYNKIDTTI